MTRLFLAGVTVLDFIFRVDQFPREAVKYRAKDAYFSGGGNAGNAATAVARLGGEVVLASRLGNDPVADLIERNLDAEGIDRSLVRRFEDCRSSFSSIFIDDDGERQIVNFRDMEINMGAEWLGPLIPENIDAFLAETRWPDGGRVSMETARARGKPGIIDAETPTREAEAGIRAASHVAFSARGARDFTGATDLEQAARAAFAETGAIITITDGENPVLMLKENEFTYHPAFTIDAVDTLAAGDVWHGAFALSLGRGDEEAQAIRFANAAAALKCQRRGGSNAAPTLAEVTQFLEKNA